MVRLKEELVIVNMLESHLIHLRLYLFKLYLCHSGAKELLRVALVECKKLLLFRRRKNYCVFKQV